MEADQIWAEIQQINSMLETTSSNSERQHLLERKRVLQTRARTLAADGVSELELELELAEAERRWILLQGERIDPVRHAGGDFGGDIRAGVDVIYMNKKIDAAQGREALEARIAELRRMIEARRTD